MHVATKANKHVMLNATRSIHAKHWIKLCIVPNIFYHWLVAMFALLGIYSCSIIIVHVLCTHFINLSTDNTITTVILTPNPIKQ